MCVLRHFKTKSSQGAGASNLIHIQMSLLNSYWQRGVTMHVIPLDPKGNHLNFYFFIFGLSRSKKAFVVAVPAAKSCPTLCYLQHAGLPCPSLSPRVCSSSRPLNWWYYPTISFSVTPFPPALNLSQHQSLFQWIGSSHQMAKVLELLGLGVSKKAVEVLLCDVRINITAVLQIKEQQQHWDLE